MRALILLAMTVLASVSWANEKSEICRQHTEGKKAYSICMQHGSENQTHLSACATIALAAGNTFKTQPFKHCLTVSKARSLTEDQVRTCGNTSGTHLGFMNCLTTI